MKIYIRFSNDIHGDIEKGYSVDFRDKSKLLGLCSWGTEYDSRINSEEEILEGCKRFAAQIVKNGYGGYTSDSEVHILTGEYVGSGNDGVCISNVRIIESFYLES